LRAYYQSKPETNRKRPRKVVFFLYPSRRIRYFDQSDVACEESKAIVEVHLDGTEKDISRCLAAARAGCGNALGEALEGLRHYLLLVARHQLDHALQAKGGASDLVQETFLEAHRDFALFHGASEEELRAWLRRLLLNNLANFSRRYRETNKRQLAREMSFDAKARSSSPAGRLPADCPSPSDQAIMNEQDSALQAALARLSDDHRSVLLLRYRDGLAFEDIGVLMQRSANAMRKLWSRALERLHEEMEASAPPR
jgi:RNA polymerase sigma-70 factor, ECF subfamily